MIAREVIDLPEPDSPTSPKTSPEAMEKLRSRTAAEVWAVDALDPADRVEEEN